jgi:hypothetical protein
MRLKLSSAFDAIAYPQTHYVNVLIRLAKQ